MESLIIKMVNKQIQNERSSLKYFLGEEVIIKHQSRKTRRENLLESMIKKIQGE